MSVEKTLAPINKNTIPVEIKLNKSSSVILYVGVSSEPSFATFFRTKNAVAKAKTYIKPYQRKNPKNGTPGKISGYPRRIIYI